MALWVCSGGGCGTAYSLRLSRCPRCHGIKFVEDSTPKIARHAGASDRAMPILNIEEKAEPSSSEPGKSAPRKAARTQARR